MGDKSFHEELISVSLLRIVSTNFEDKFFIKGIEM